MGTREGHRPLARGARRTRTNEMNLIQQLEAEAIEQFASTKTIPEFRPGDTLRVGVKVVEGERTRIQNFEGVCIARANRGLGSSFTVRKISFGEGVERVFPLYSPNVEFDRGRPPRRRPPRQALLSARPHRQIGPHRRAPRHPPSRQGQGRSRRRQGGDRQARDGKSRGLSLPPHEQERGRSLRRPPFSCAVIPAQAEFQLLRTHRRDCFHG